MKRNFLQIHLISVAVATAGFAAPVMADSGLSGALTANYLSSEMWSSDDSDEWHGFQGASASGYIQGEAYGYLWSADITALYRDLSPYGNPRTEYRDQGPREYEVIGLHAGKYIGDYYVGGFGGIGFQQTDLNYDKMQPGYIVGIESKRRFNNLTAFGQIAYMDWRYADRASRPHPDNGFSGMMLRAGVSYDITDRISAMADVEYGYSPNYFEDYGDWGSLLVGKLQVSYAINDRFDMIAGYEYGQFTANTEDFGLESNITLGLRMNFGGASGFNELATPVQGFAAAGWAKTTD